LTFSSTGSFPALSPAGLEPGRPRLVKRRSDAFEESAMASDEDELPLRPTSKPPDLRTWSIEELEAYIRRLEGEIERARAQIGAKQSFKGAAEALFKKR
jgi:uncharacterized small protein (DUF1192 family)